MDLCLASLPADAISDVASFISRDHQILEIREDEERVQMKKGALLDLNEKLLCYSNVVKQCSHLTTVIKNTVFCVAQNSIHHQIVPIIEIKNDLLYVKY